MPAAVHTRVGAYSAGAAREMLGQLISARASAGFSSQYLKQVDAWEEELRLLDTLCRTLIAQLPASHDWTLLLEYPVPRRNKSPDAILLASDLIFVLEFKVGAIAFDAVASWQVEDYALDLRDFHQESRGRSIIPILVATGAVAPQQPATLSVPNPMPSVWPVQFATPIELPGLIAAVFRAAHRTESLPIDAMVWDNSPYRPTLSIIEAAQELFGSHSVREFSHKS